MDYEELMRILSVPRPNGSQAERRTGQSLEEWFASRGIPYRVHPFRLYPYFFEWIGLWLILSRGLLALAFLLRWGWPAVPISLIGLAGGLVDIGLNIPLVSFLGARQGRNLIAAFDPARAAPTQELILSAHYDSKSEPLDHHQRMFFILNLRTGILLTLALGILGPIDRFLLDSGSPGASFTYLLGALLIIPLLFLAWGLGLNLASGRFSPQSQGAVDNGAACAILLGLADSLSTGGLVPERTRVTLALFTGEEVNMQGSRAYVRDRDWELPTAAVNLEVMAQDGPYIYWEQDGTSLGISPTNPALNHGLAETVQDVTGQPAFPAGPINSDGASFLRAGVPVAVLGTYHATLRDRGFHSPSDCLGRVTMQRLPEGVEILARFIARYDQGRIQFIQAPADAGSPDHWKGATDEK